MAVSLLFLQDSQESQTSYLVWVSSLEAIVTMMSSRLQVSAEREGQSYSILVHFYVGVITLLHFPVFILELSDYLLLP